MAMHAPSLGLRINMSTNTENTLILEAIGSPIGEVESCRLRTRFKHIKGFDVYFEIRGCENSENLPKIMSELNVPFIGFIDQLKRKHELNETKFKRVATRSRYFEYSKEGIINLVNTLSIKKYTKLDIRHDVNVLETEDCIC